VTTAAFEPRREILLSAQTALWPRLKGATDLGFVLYSRTAVALRLGHRSSIDFDFFPDKPLDRDEIRRCLPFFEQSTSLQDKGDTWIVLAPPAGGSNDRVKVSMFGSIGIGRVGRPQLTADGVLRAASIDDLMATKVKVLLQRADAKDYRDIAAMLRAGADLSHALAAARAMFGPNFQPAESLKSLVCFEDGDLASLAPVDKQVLHEAVAAVGKLPPVLRVSDRLTA
jgi:hypothetical protein